MLAGRGSQTWTNNRFHFDRLTAEVKRKKKGKQENKNKEAEYDLKNEAGDHVNGSSCYYEDLQRARNEDSIRSPASSTQSGCHVRHPRSFTGANAHENGTSTQSCNKRPFLRWYEYPGCEKPEDGMSLRPGEMKGNSAFAFTHYSSQS